MDVTRDPLDSTTEFDHFYSASADRVLRQLVLLTGDLAEAEDVTQEAFERAWLRWSTVRLSVSPEAWVRTVARRLAVSRWRRTRNASIAWLRRGAPVTVELAPENIALMAALGELPMAQRVALVLYHLGDLSVAQVADETGSSVAAVKQQLARGRAALAISMSDEDVRPAAKGEGQ